MKNKGKKVICAMSGGVDSSVAAALLKEAGVNVVGVFMKFWKAPDKDGLADGWNRCCSSESEARARKVAKILKIPFYVFNFEKEFKKRVVDYFLNENKKGLTPNPCVVCNKEIKFGLLLERALKLKADYIASGHYARLGKDRPRQTYKLHKGRDKEKDQSYFLWKLNQKQLKHILFPVGKLTRKEVEKLARKFKLPFSGVKKSQEICFIKTTIEDFLKRYLKTKPGHIIGANGKILGEHEGLYFYTIGQRKGIGLPAGPYYVLGKDMKKNILIVDKNEKNLYKEELAVRNANWISGNKPKFPLKVTAKIRYRHKAVLAIVIKGANPGTLRLKFKKPQRAVTPGQSAVFYKGQELLGGGVIY